MALSVDWLRHRFGKYCSSNAAGTHSETTPLLRSNPLQINTACLKKHRVVFPNNGLLPKAQKKFMDKYPGNKIHTTKYNILSFLPKNLFEQFCRLANLYFLFLAGLNWFPQMEVFHREITMLPLAIVLAVIGFKDAVEDYRRYKSDKRINHGRTTVFDG